MLGIVKTAAVVLIVTAFPVLADDWSDELDATLKTSRQSERDIALCNRLNGYDISPVFTISCHSAVENGTFDVKQRLELRGIMAKWDMQIGELVAEAEAITGGWAVAIRKRCESGKEYNRCMAALARRKTQLESCPPQFLKLPGDDLMVFSGRTLHYAVPACDG